MRRTSIFGDLFDIKVEDGISLHTHHYLSKYSRYFDPSEVKSPEGPNIKSPELVGEVNTHKTYSENITKYWNIIKDKKEPAESFENNHHHDWQFRDDSSESSTVPKPIADTITSCQDSEANSHHATLTSIGVSHLRRSESCSTNVSGDPIHLNDNTHKNPLPNTPIYFPGIDSTILDEHHRPLELNDVVNIGDENSKENFSEELNKAHWDQRNSLYSSDLNKESIKENNIGCYRAFQPSEKCQFYIYSKNSKEVVEKINEKVFRMIGFAKNRFSFVPSEILRQNEEKNKTRPTENRSHNKSSSFKCKEASDKRRRGNNFILEAERYKNNNSIT